MNAVICYCGGKAELTSNARIYGREYGNGKIWLCQNFRICRGYVGTHADGRPLGTLVDDETRKLRIRVHAIIDPFWKEANNGRSRKRNRGSVYGWMARIMAHGRPYHTGDLTKEECVRALTAIAANPYRPHVEQKETAQ